MAWSNPMNTTNEYIKYQIGVHLISQNVANNTSNVNVYVKVYRTNTGYNTYGTGTIYCRINGIMYSADINSNQYINENGIVLFTRNMNITHSIVGQKTLDCSAWINHSRFSSNEQAYSENLPSIARATTPVLSPNPIVLGNELTISLPRASSAFTHNMRYVCGNASGVIAEGVGAEYKWTVPIELASQFPKSDSAICSIVCYTFYNGSQVGSKTVHFTVSIYPSAIPPVKQIRWIDVNGYKQKYNGSFIQNKSRMRFEMEAEGTKGSVVEKITFDIDGKYHGENNTGVFESLIFTQTAGTIQHRCQVIDSRGRVTTLDPLVYDVCAYDSPKINKFDVRRCNQNGTANDEGAYMKINYAAVISPIYNRNSKRFTVYYKPQGTTSWTVAADVTNAYSVDTSVIVAADTEKEYDLKFEIKDDFETVSKTWELSTAYTLMDFKSSGKGIAFGKVSEKDNSFEISPNWSIDYEGSQAPFLRAGDNANKTFDSFGKLWTALDAEMRKSKTKSIVDKVSILNMSIPNGSYMVIASCNNYVGNGQYPVQGSLLLMNYVGLYWGYTTGGQNSVSDMGFYPRSIL